MSRPGIGITNDAATTSRTPRSLTAFSGASSLKVTAASSLLVLASFSGSCDRSPVASTAPAKVYEISGRLASLRVSLDRDRMTTADRLTLSIETTAEIGSRASVPLEHLTFEGWTLVERSDSETVRGTSGRSVRVARIVLEPFLDGEYVIPAIAARASSEAAGDNAGAAETIQTPDITVIVSSTLPEGSDTRDVPGAVEYAARDSVAGREVAILVGAIAVATAPVLVWLAFHRRRSGLSGLIDERALRLLTLRRAVERRDYSSISPDLLSRVIAESVPDNQNASATSELRRLTARLDAWRFGGATLNRDELSAAANSTARLVEAVNDPRPAEVIA